LTEKRFDHSPQKSKDPRAEENSEQPARKTDREWADRKPVQSSRKFKGSPPERNADRPQRNAGDSKPPRKNGRAPGKKEPRTSETKPLGKISGTIAKAETKKGSKPIGKFGAFGAKKTHGK